jgi:hypothetical protein
MYEAVLGAYVISTDPARLDLDMLHAFLREAYWSTGIPREVERGIQTRCRSASPRTTARSAASRV